MIKVAGIYVIDEIVELDPPEFDDDLGIIEHDVNVIEIGFAEDLNVAYQKFKNDRTNAAQSFLVAEILEEYGNESSTEFRERLEEALVFWKEEGRASVGDKFQEFQLRARGSY